MTIQTKTIGRLPVYLGDYDNTRSYGKKNRVTLYGSEFESKHDNNNTAPATWDGAETITFNTTDWQVISNGTDAWIAGNDKPASSEEFPYNGMGRVVLKKNMVEGDNILTQDAFEDGEGNPLNNTIFVIKYDFVLGEDITIPANCVLEFDGGSIIRNSANVGDIFCENLLNTEFHVEDFGVKTTNTATENSKNIKTLRNLAYGRRILFGSGIYRFNEPIEFHDGHLTIIGSGGCSGGSSPAAGVAIHSGTTILADGDFSGGDYLLDLMPSTRNYNWGIELRNFEVYCGNKCGGIRTEVYDQSIISNIVISKHAIDKPGLFLNGSHLPGATGNATISENSIFENIYVYGYDWDHNLKRTAPNILLQGLEQCTLTNLVSGAYFEDDIETGVLYCYDCRGCEFIACGLGGGGDKATSIWLDSCYGITFDTTTIEGATIPIRVLSSNYGIFPSSGNTFTPVEPLSTVTQSNGFSAIVQSSTANGIYLWMAKGTFDRTIPLMCGNTTVISANTAVIGTSVPSKTSNIWFTNTRIFNGNPSSISESISEIHDLRHGYFDFFATGQYGTDFYKFHIFDTCDDVTVKANSTSLIINDSPSCYAESKRGIVAATNANLSTLAASYDEIYLSGGTYQTGSSFQIIGVDLGNTILAENTLLKRRYDGKFYIVSCRGYLISNEQLIERGNNTKEATGSIYILPYQYKYTKVTAANVYLQFTKGSSIPQCFAESYIYVETACKYYCYDGTAIIINNTEYDGSGGYLNISAGTVIRCIQIPNKGFVLDVVCGNIELPT